MLISSVMSVRRAAMCSGSGTLMVILLSNIIVLSKGSLRLFGSPSTAIEGGLFTLTCGNRSSGRSAMSWYMNDSMVFTTNYEEGQPNDCTLSLGGQSPYRYMARRVTVSCDTRQHNVTLTIISTLDSGSVWHCESTKSNGATRATSVKLIINVTTRESTTMSTYGSSTSTTTLEPSNSDNRGQDAHITVFMHIAGGGGGAFIIVCIIGLVCLTRGRHRHEHSEKENRPVIENGNLNTALQDDSSEEDIMVENDLYERSSDVIIPAAQDLGKADDHQVEGYTVKECPPANWNENRNPTFQHDSSDDDIMVENDLYERSSDVISQVFHYLGNTDGVTDDKVTEANITQPDPVPVIASPDSGDDQP